MFCLTSYPACPAHPAPFPKEKASCKGILMSCPGAPWLTMNRYFIFTHSPLIYTVISLESKHCLFVFSGGIYWIFESESKHRDGTSGAAWYHKDNRPECTDIADRQRVHHWTELPDRWKTQTGNELHMVNFRNVLKPKFKHDTQCSYSHSKLIFFKCLVSGGDRWGATSVSTVRGNGPAWRVMAGEGAWRAPAQSALTAAVMPAWWAAQAAAAHPQDPTPQPTSAALTATEIWPLLPSAYETPR